MMKVKAILSAYDGTLCPTASITHKHQNRIPPLLASILEEISSEMPVCIVSSKDLDFLSETIHFCRVLSCIMGIETIVIEDLDTTILARSDHKFRCKLSTDISVLRTISKTLETLVIHFEYKADFPGIAVERKRTSDGIVAGITIDWRNLNRWPDRKKAVEHTVSATVARLQRAPLPMNLFVQKYSDHPFIDIYAVECSKGIGFDRVMLELSAKGVGPKDVLYLGDSENDNPAFTKAGVSIGIRSDSRIKPELNCTHYVAFDRLAAFLAELKENHFDFSPSFLAH